MAKNYILISQINMTPTGLLVFFLALTTIHAQNVCSGKSICINIRNCPAVISILMSRPLSAEEAEILRNSQCGYEGNDLKICCNQVTTTITTTTTMTTTTTTTTTTVEPEIEILDPPDVTNHPNLRLLNHQACGPVPQQKVIGGNKTEIFQYPWMTLIAYDTGKPNSEFLCGGTIIASRYVLTAAHCVTSRANGRVIGVRVGDHDISKERDCIKNNKEVEVVCAERYQDFGINNIHPHPKYNIFTMRNDIALIRLNGTVDFRPRNVKPICLPFGTAATLSHSKAIVTGWGITNWLDDQGSQELLQARLPLVTNEQCTEIYKDYVTQVWYKQLCAGGQENVDACAGDSGGPLQAAGIYNGESVRIIQHGVVSFGMGCGLRGIPGVYTRVSYYMKWILDTMIN